MPKLLDSTKQVIAEVNNSAAAILSSINSFTEEYNHNYLLQDCKDGQLLKTMMKEKIELGIQNYDS